MPEGERSGSIQLLSRWHKAVRPSVNSEKEPTMATAPDGVLAPNGVLPPWLAKGGMMRELRPGPPSSSRNSRLPTRSKRNGSPQPPLVSKRIPAFQSVMTRVPPNFALVARAVGGPLLMLNMTFVQPAVFVEKEWTITVNSSVCAGVNTMSESSPIKSSLDATMTLSDTLTKCMTGSGLGEGHHHPVVP